jgi:hypothetical protein
MQPKRRSKGRPRAHAAFEQLEKDVSASKSSRARFVDNIGLYWTRRGLMVSAKIHLPHGGVFRGKQKAPGSSVEKKLGLRSSFEWLEIIQQRNDLIRRAENCPSSYKMEQLSVLINRGSGSFFG